MVQLTFPFMCMEITHIFAQVPQVHCGEQILSDGDGKITALTTEDNVTIPVTWHSGDM